MVRDHDYWADLYDAYANELFAGCLASLGDVDAAAEAVHATFVTAAARIDGLRDPRRISEWLAAVARYEASAARCARLLRLGRDDCAALARIAPRRHTPVDAPTRVRIARHAEQCLTCGPTWNRSADVVAIGAPVALRHYVLNDPRLIDCDASVDAWLRGGFPPSDADGSRRRLFAGLAAAVAVFLVAGGVVVANGNDAPTRRVAAPARRTTTSAAQDADPAATALPITSTTSAAARVTTTTRPKMAPTTLARNAAGAAVPAAPKPTTTTVGSFSISASAHPTTIACNSGAATVTATPHGGTPSGLFLHWREDNGSGGAKNMNQSGDSWTAQLGPFDHAESVTWWVSTSFLGGGNTDSASHSETVSC